MWGVRVWSRALAIASAGGAIRQVHGWGADVTGGDSIARFRIGVWEPKRNECDQPVDIHHSSIGGHTHSTK